MLIVNNFSFAHKKHIILSDISISLENKRYALLGNNGSGKTTFFRCVSGYYSNYKGEILNELNKSPKIGYLPQTFGAYHNLTVKETLEYIAILKKVHNISEEVENVFKYTQLEEFKDKKIKQLSGGMLRRLGIAQAIMGSVDAILLDEPTVGLDIQQRKVFYDMIQQLPLNKTVVISTHIPEDVKNIADEVLILKNGKIYRPDWDVKDSDFEEKYICFHG